MGYLKAVPSNDNVHEDEEHNTLEHAEEGDVGEEDPGADADGNVDGGGDDDDDDDDDSYDSEADDDYSDEDDDDSSFDSDMEDEAARLMQALQAGAPTVDKTPKKSPQQVMNEFLTTFQKGESTALKVTDSLVSWIEDDKIVTTEEERTSAISNLCHRILKGIRASPKIQHVVLGECFLLLLNPGQQISIFEALLKDSRYTETITYWKLGSDDSIEPTGIPTDTLLELLAAKSFPRLTEIEIRGMALDTIEQIQQGVKIVQQTPTLKIFNLLGLVINDDLAKIPGVLDPLLRAVGPVKDLDEVQLSRNVNDAAPTSNATPSSLVSTTALTELLSVRPKWWRLALDGMDLLDEHLQIIGTNLQSNPNCRMNDLLSIKDNPHITPNGLRTLYKVCINKQRMGLVLSDDPEWVATFDLVRPLNNLHRRLEYKDAQGKYLSKDKWIDWLVVLNNLPWLDDNRKLNYVWFTLLDQPDMVLASF